MTVNGGPNGKAGTKNNTTKTAINVMRNLQMCNHTGPPLIHESSEHYRLQHQR